MIRKSALAALLMICAGAGTALAQDKPPASQKDKVGIIRLSDTLSERPQTFSISLASLTSMSRGPALSNLITSLTAAAKDNSLSGLVLDLSSFSLDLNQAQEIGGLLGNLRKAGKRVVIYASDYDTATYVLASYAGTVLMPESGDVLIPGVGMQMIFFAGTLEKLHLSADFVQVGKFKGAEEPYTRKSASPEYRQQIEKLISGDGGMYEQLVNTIAANRPNMTKDQVIKAIDDGWLTGKQAKEIGLVDQTMPRQRLDEWLNSQFKNGATTVPDYGQPKRESVDLSSPFGLLSLLAGGGSGGKVTTQPTIAVIYATGEIVGDSPSAEDSSEYVTPSGIRKAVKKALDDPHVRAIVVRVDSPGGSASASDEIWSILKDADKKKPVSISMGHLAASGGYFISCAGRRIMADPATITGSIGVVGGKIVLQGALDWAGLNIESVAKGKHAEMLSMLRPFTDEERFYIKNSMEDVYGVFTNRVAAARGEKVAHLEEVAQGRLFTGIQAKQVGLVDEVGSLNEAVKIAARGAGLGDEYQILILPEAKSLSDLLREGLFSDIRAPLSLAGMKPDALDTLVTSLPAEIRRPTLHALHHLQTLQRERLLMAMPPGLVETHGARP
jgi:protease IV